MNTSTSGKLSQFSAFAFNVAQVCGRKIADASVVIKNAFAIEESSEEAHQCGSECSECCSDIRSISMASSSEYSQFQFPRDSFIENSKRLSKMSQNYSKQGISPSNKENQLV